MTELTDGWDLVGRASKHEKYWEEYEVGEFATRRCDCAGRLEVITLLLRAEIALFWSRRRCVRVSLFRNCFTYTGECDASYVIECETNRSGRWAFFYENLNAYGIMPEMFGSIYMQISVVSLLKLEIANTTRFCFVVNRLYLIYKI